MNVYDGMLEEIIIMLASVDRPEIDPLTYFE